MCLQVPCMMPQLHNLLWNEAYHIKLLATNGMSKAFA